MASCCMSSDMSAFLITAFRSLMVKADVRWSDESDASSQQSSRRARGMSPPTERRNSNTVRWVRSPDPVVVWTWLGAACGRSRARGAADSGCQIGQYRTALMRNYCAGGVWPGHAAPGGGIRGGPHRRGVERHHREPAHPNPGGSTAPYALVYMRALSTVQPCSCKTQSTNAAPTTSAGGRRD